MKSHWKRGSAIALVTMAAALLVPACAENESSMFIRGCLIPSADSCSVEPSEDALLSLGGFLDVSQRSAYGCALLIGNQLVPVGDDITLRTETSRIFVYAFDVDVTNSLTGEIIASFTSPSSGVVDPAQGSPPGYNAVNALLVDVDTAASIAAKGGEVVVTVVARGRTLGGTELESAPWQFPIGICDGCTCGETNPDNCAGTELKGDCLQGIDGHCRFVDTKCP